MAKRAGKCAWKFVGLGWLAVAIASACPANAYENLFRPFSYLSIPHLHQKVDFFGGVDIADAVSFAWAGATYAPLGTLAEDGWRVRFMGGAGRYTYRTSIVPGGINDANVYAAEVLGGYRKTFDNIFGQKAYVGVFAGAAYEDQMLLYADPFNPAQGSEAGVKATAEIYSRISQNYILTAFATASSVHNKYYAKSTLLYELNETWALGGEVATMGDARYTEHRAGLAGSLTWRRKIFVLSAGALDNSGRGTGAYATLSIYSPF